MIDFEVILIFFTLSFISSLTLFFIKRKSYLFTTSLVVLIIAIFLSISSLSLKFISHSWITHFIFGFLFFIGLNIIIYFIIHTNTNLDSKKNNFQKAFILKPNKNLNDNIFNLKESIELLAEEKKEIISQIHEILISLQDSRESILNISKELNETITFINRVISFETQDEPENKDKISNLNLFQKALETMFDLDKTIQHTIDEMKNQSMTLQLTFDAFDMTTMSMEKVDNITKEASQLANGLSESAMEGSDSVEQTANAIEEISKSSLMMEEFVATIKNISEKTNLLAMNAAIEAAHAGEKGKGFAIVASEVRKLSMSTNTATAEIKKSIKQILEKIENAVSLVNNTKVLFNSILEDIKSTNSLNQQVYEISKKNVIQGKEIIVAVNQLKAIAQRIIEASADELFQTNEVIIAMNEIHSVVKTITQGVSKSFDEINNIVDDFEDKYNTFERKTKEIVLEKLFLLLKNY